jgi:hypothetical protein
MIKYSSKRPVKPFDNKNFLVFIRKFMTGFNRTIKVEDFNDLDGPAVLVVFKSGAEYLIGYDEKDSQYFSMKSVTTYSNDYYEPDNSEWVEMKNSRNSMSEACHDVVADEKNDEINNFNESLAFHLDEMLEEESLDLSL